MAATWILDVFTQDVDEKCPYSVPWAAVQTAEGATVTGVTWIVETGLTVGTSGNGFPPTFVGAVATAWLWGGTAGETYYVTCRATFNTGLVDDHTFRLYVTQD